MVEFTRGNERLVLSAGAEVSIELTVRTLSTEVADDFTVAFDVPIRGNEIALGHAHHLALRNRLTKLTDWFMRVDDASYAGVLYIEGATDQVISVSFVVNDLVGEIDDANLRSLDYGPSFDFVKLIDHAKDVNTSAFPTQSYCFPMHYNPTAYGSANPHWSPSASPYVPGNSYQTNDLVTYEEVVGTVRHTWIYQCIANTSLGPGATAYWRKTGFAIVNPWDPVAEAFRENDVSGNFYALSPWFYMKWVLQKALAAVGFSIAGDFWDDPATDRIVLEGVRCVDSMARTGYMLASSSATQTFAGVNYNDFILGADNETTPPNQDADGLWASPLYTPPPLAPGLNFIVFRFRIHVRFSTPKQLRIQMVDTGTGDGNNPLGHPEPVFAFAGPAQLEWDEEITQAVLADDGAVSNPIANGRTYSFSLQDNDPDASTSYSAEVYSFSVQSWLLDVDGWTTGDAAPRNTYANTIVPAEHMPDTTLGELIAACCEAFGLEPKPDRSKKVLHLDYAHNTLSAQPIDVTERLRSPIRITTSARSPGQRIRWEQDAPNFDLTGYRLTQTQSNEEALSPPSGPGEYAVVTNSRRLYISVPALDGFFWRPVGHQLTSVLYGETKGASDTTLAIGPVLMDIRTIEGELYLLPSMEKELGSSLFNTPGNSSSLRFAWFAGLQPNNDGHTYPFASAFALNHIGTGLPNAISADLDTAHATTYIHARTQAAVLGMPFEADLEVDPVFLASGDYAKPLLIHNQRCQLETLPLIYSQDPGPMVARGARFIKLPTEGIIYCAGGLRVFGAGTPGVDGIYCPDGEHNARPVWTKMGGVRLSDSIYYGDTSEWYITSGGTYDDDVNNVKYVAVNPPTIGYWITAVGGASPPANSVYI
jgi:hypothetical protein